MHNVTVAFAALLVMLLSYFFGCFNGSFMVSHFIIRDDVRKHGSGNAGLTNFYRTYGAKYALLVIACDMGKTVADIKAIIASLHEFNPMMGHRGCRLCVTYPEIAEMQTNAVIKAALKVSAETGTMITPYITAWPA